MAKTNVTPITTTAAPAAGTLFTVRFRQEKETKGALRYQEINDAGEDAGAWAKIGTLYVRKTAFAQGATIPKELTVSVS